jgi:hypothetical protein
VLSGNVAAVEKLVVLGADPNLPVGEEQKPAMHVSSAFYQSGRNSGLVSVVEFLYFLFACSHACVRLLARAVAACDLLLLLLLCKCQCRVLTDCTTAAAAALPCRLLLRRACWMLSPSWWGWALTHHTTAAAHLLLLLLFKLQAAAKKGLLDVVTKPVGLGADSPHHCCCSICCCCCFNCRLLPRRACWMLSPSWWSWALTGPMARLQQ